MARLTWNSLFIQLALVPISLIAFWVLLGFKVALALVIVTICHELGHAITARTLGLRLFGIYMIPFMGGMVRHAPYRDSIQEFLIIFAGPLSGLLLSACMFVAGHHLHIPFLTLVGFLAAILNLFNLLPLPAMDGGRLLSMYSGSIHPYGSMSCSAGSAVTCCALCVTLHGAFILLAGIAVADSVYYWKNEQKTHKLPLRCAYLLLVGYTVVAGCLANLAVLHIGHQFIH